MQAAVNAENARAAMLESNAHAKEQFIATQKQVWKAVFPNGRTSHLSFVLTALACLAHHCLAFFQTPHLPVCFLVTGFSLFFLSTLLFAWLTHYTSSILCIVVDRPAPTRR